MKKVFSSHSEVCHVWAQRVQDEGEAGNIFFIGDSIYSWGMHYKAAMFLEDVVLINSYKYSPSTGQHLCHIEGALNRNMKRFYVPNLGSTSRSGPDKLGHKENLESYREEFRNNLKLAARARSRREDYLNTARYCMHQAYGYATQFRCKRLCWKPTKIELSVLSGEGMIEFSAKEKAKIAARNLKAKKLKEKREAEEKVRLEKLKGEWLKGEHHASMILRYPDTLLRIVGDEVQTSKGARFPCDEALKAYHFVKCVRSQGVDWKRNGETFQLGYYQLDLVTKQGHVKAGCHFVRWEEIERIGNMLLGLKVPTQAVS